MAPLGVVLGPANSKAMPGRRLRPAFVRVEQLSRTLQNNLATGTLGANVTAANSGGQSGAVYNDQFTFYAPSQRPVYDNAHTHGASTLAMRIDEASGAVLTNYAGWNSLLMPPGQQVFGRLYFYLTANPSQNVQLVRLTDKTNINTLIGGVRLTNTGTLVALKANNAILGSATTAMPLNQWIRLEYRLLPSSVSGVGEVEFRVWTTNPESSGAADFTQNNTAVSSLGGDQVGAVAHGICSAPTAFTAAWSIWIDDVAGAAYDWLGPSTIALPVARSLSDLVFSAPYPGALTYPSQTLFPGSSMSDAIGAAKTSGGTTFSRTATDTGATNTDTVATNRARPLTDTGTTNTDSVATVRVHLVADTGATITDAVATQRVHGIADTGTTNTDTTKITVNRPVSDTGATVSDSVVGGRGFARAISDTGATNTDSVATVRVHVVSDTGVSVSDTVATRRTRPLADTATTMSDSVVGGRGFARAVSDTAATVTDSTSTLRVHVVSDTGATVSDLLARRISRVISDTGATISDSPTTTRILHVTLSDTGTTITDSVSAGAGLPPSQVVDLFGYVGRVSASAVVGGGASGLVKL